LSATFYLKRSDPVFDTNPDTNRALLAELNAATKASEANERH